VVFATRRASLGAPPEFEVLMSVSDNVIGRVRHPLVDAFMREGLPTASHRWFEPSIHAVLPGDDLRKTLAVCLS